MSSQAKKDAAIAQFRQFTGAGQADAVRFLKKSNYRLEAAVDAFFGDSSAVAAAANPPPARESSAASMATKLNALFDKYKDPTAETIGVEGTMQFCQDIDLDLEDVVLVALAAVLKSPQMGEWTRTGWVDGWKSLKCDSIPTIKSALPGLRAKLASDPAFYRQVYLHAFEFAKAPGQRSIPMDTAKAFWALLLPAGQKGHALAHEGGSLGWKPEYNQWWFEFLDAKGGKGVSRDTWNMFIDFIRAIDVDFSNHDEEAAWPSLIDEFVEVSRERIKNF